MLEGLFSDDDAVYEKVIAIDATKVQPMVALPGDPGNGIQIEDLPEGVARPGLKSVHINKCPMLVTAKMADPETAKSTIQTGISTTNPKRLDASVTIQCSG